MQVAILISRYRISCLEDCLGLLTGLKLRILESALGLKDDELDIVNIRHGMCHRANLYSYSIAINSNCRDVFL